MVRYLRLGELEVEAQNYRCSMVERKGGQGVKQRYVDLRGVARPQQMKLPIRYSLSANQVSAAIDHRLLEIGTRLIDPRPGLKNLGECVLNGVMGSRSRAEDQRGAAELTRQLRLIELSERERLPASLRLHRPIVTHYQYPRTEVHISYT